MSNPAEGARWQTMRILWFAICSSQGILAFLLWFLRFGPAEFEGAPLKAPIDLYVMAFGGVAVADGVISVLLPRWQLRQQAQKLGIPLGGKLSSEQLIRLMPFAQASLILGLALSESVSLLGFVAGFLGAKPVQFVPFFVAGILLSLWRFPGESWLRGLLGASDSL